MWLRQTDGCQVLKRSKPAEVKQVGVTGKSLPDHEPTRPGVHHSLALVREGYT